MLGALGGQGAFAGLLKDLLTLIVTKYRREFYNLYDGTDLVLYEKYTRRDVCRLLRWDRDEGSTVNGYRVKHGTCPIFVTYHKDEELQYTIQYQDQFVNRHQFSWMTRGLLIIIWGGCGL